MASHPNNHTSTDISIENEFLGNFSELKIILREDFGLDLKKDDVHNIGISLTGYIDTLLEISKE